MSDRQFRLGVCQLMSRTDKEENMKRAEEMVREAAAGGASVVVLPEVFQCPFGHRYFRPYSEARGGESMQRMSAWAKELGIKYMTLHMRLLRHPELSFEEAILYENPDSKPIIYEGKEYSRKDLCKKYNIPLSLFYDRYHKGWSIERILKTPKLTSRYDKRNHFTNRTKESTEL